MERCLQRARYEIRRVREIRQLIKGWEEFMNLSDQEKSYAALIKAEMLASIEGRLILNYSPSELFVRAQEELRLAEKELLSETFSNLRNHYLYRGYSEEKFRIFQQLYLKYRCKYGVEPEPYIHEALSTISCELMSPYFYVNYAPHERMCFCLETADYLFRGFSFKFFGEEWTTERTYYKPQEASCMLQAYQNSLRLGTSLFERLWLQLSSEL
ncbi:MAG: hypothetical protein K2X28_06335 [Alphaproteobacteria bacterium]|nr:hypothetical protein [Alphaproteobacteria bacterium]